MPVLGTAKKDFAPRVDDVRAARRFAATAAVCWGMESRDVETVVGELAANAFRHAGTRFSVSLSCDDDVLAVEVADGSSGVPAIAGRPHARSLVTGRGLLMVDALANDWGARTTPDGKIVWAELPAVRVRGGPG
jgi:anti-sigma regulatory factor (Ser/Thr protein kinase)